jgi:hypothetical protein
MEEQGKRRQQNGWCLVNGEQVRRFLLLPHPRCKLEPRYEFIRVITIGIHGNQHGPFFFKDDYGCEGLNEILLFKPSFCFKS